MEAILLTEPPRGEIQPGEVLFYAAFLVSGRLQRLARGCGNIELIRKSSKLALHFRPLRRHGTVEGNVGQPLVDFLRAIQNDRESGVGLFLALKCLKHAYCLVVEALAPRAAKGHRPHWVRRAFLVRPARLT